MRTLEEVRDRSRTARPRSRESAGRVWRELNPFEAIYAQMQFAIMEVALSQGMCKEEGKDKSPVPVCVLSGGKPFVRSKMPSERLLMLDRV